MISLIPSKASGRRLVLIAVGLALYANGALPAEPAFDPQELVRQFILGEPKPRSLADSNTEVTRVASTVGTVRVDLEEQVRRFILGKPAFESVADSSANAAVIESAPSRARLDAQEQVRQFLLGKPSLTVSAGRVTRDHRGGHLRVA